MGFFSLPQRQPTPPTWISVMDAKTLVTAQSVLPALKVSSKEEALAMLSERAACVVGLDPRDIYNALMERERLGTTGIGSGVAIPHGRMNELQRPCVVFARLITPIPFEAIDEQPVDLLFLLLSPEREGAVHLKALSRISRLLHDTNMCRKLRSTTTAEGLRGLLADHLAG